MLAEVVDIDIVSTPSLDLHHVCLEWDKDKEPTKEPTVPCNPPLNELSFAEEPLDELSFAEEPLDELSFAEEPSDELSFAKEPTVSCNLPATDVACVQHSRTKKTVSPKTNVGRENALMYKLHSFYQHPAHMERLATIVTGTSKLSLRIVDWFVTNYAKLYFTHYMLSKPGPHGMEMVRFKVHNEYRLYLDSHSKHRMDPFCRSKRVVFPWKENMALETTVGQMNFFMWAIHNRVFDYVEEHFEDIEKDMNARNSTSIKRRNNNNNTSSTTPSSSTEKTRKKRTELSMSASKTLRKEHVQVVIRFT